VDVQAVETAVQNGVTVAQAVGAGLAGSGLIEAGRRTLSWVARRREARRAAAIVDQDRAAQAMTVEHDRAKTDHDATVAEWQKIAEERQAAELKTQAAFDKYRRETHERITQAQTEINQMHSERLERETRAARLEARVEACELERAELRRDQDELKRRLARLETARRPKRKPVRKPLRNPGAK
jgi:chromosome segregation ATPase